jgi:hypothetical protein
MLTFIVDENDLIPKIKELKIDNEIKFPDLAPKVEQLEEENMILKNELDLTKLNLKEAEEVISMNLISNI